VGGEQRDRFVIRVSAALAITVVIASAIFAIVRYEQSAGGGYDGLVIVIAGLSALGAATACIALGRALIRTAPDPRLIGWIAVGIFSSLGLLVAGLAFGLRG